MADSCYRRGAHLLLALAVLLLPACGHQSPPVATSPATPAAATEELFAVGTGRLGLYAQPAADRPTAFLPLHETVVRTTVRDGWAFVRVARSGQTGWVNDAQLIRVDRPFNRAPPG